ncbi:MAG: hypothetical protein WA191_19445 [Telluria sp.]|nr:hypothetical protein [Telluria sp.]
MKITHVEVIPISTQMKRARLMRGATLSRIDSVVLKRHNGPGLGIGIKEDLLGRLIPPGRKLRTVKA